MANGTLKVSNIETSSGSGTITIGQSGETISIPSGVTQTNIGGLMTPAFQARLSGTQSISNGSTTKINFDTEDFDTDSCYDNSSNYRFTPNVAGKYYISVNISNDTTSGNHLLTQARIYKNGSSYGYRMINMSGNPGEAAAVKMDAIITLNGSSDYVEAYAYSSYNDSGNGQIVGDHRSMFFGYKIIE
jgi:hypothetical protein